MDTALIDALLATGSDEDLSLVEAWLDSAYCQFQPRADQPHNGDEMTSYLTDDHPGKIVLGGTGCLASDTPIYDPVAGDTLPISERSRPFYCWSITPNGKRSIGVASAAYRKGESLLYRVELSNGLVLEATAAHALLTDAGWKEVGALRPGSRVKALNTPTAYQKDVARSWRIPPDFLARHWSRLRLRGGPFLQGLSSAKSAIEHDFLDFDREALNCPSKVELDSNYCSIVSITAVSKQDFWDFSVWPYHNYEAAGVIHHNSAKTRTTSWLLANQLYTNSPPEPNTPVWIISQTLDMSGLIWAQALSRYIDPADILTIRWRKANLYPEIVVMRPDAAGNNWCLHFYSCEQGRAALQAANVWMAWVDEQAPQEIIEEVWGRLRRWHHANQFLLTCTPLTPDPWLQDLWERRNEPSVANLYKFYRLNTLCNDWLSPEWRKNYLDSLSPDQRMTRQFGDFCNYKGVVFPEFTSDLIVDPFDAETLAYERFIGVDFGFHHPAILWVYRQGETYYVVDEDQLTDAMPEEVASKIMRRYDPGRHKVYVDYGDIISARSLKAHEVHNEPCLGKDVVDSINVVKGLFWNKKIKVFKTCRETIRQLRSYRWKEEKPDKEHKDEVIKVADHLVDALRYVIYTTIKRQTKPWEQPPSTAIHLVSKPGIPAHMRANPGGYRDPIHRR